MLDYLHAFNQGLINVLPYFTPHGTETFLYMMLGMAIAQCAVRHSAAVHLTIYEPPVGASRELVQLTSRAPTATRNRGRGKRSPGPGPRPMSSSPPPPRRWRDRRRP